MAATKRKDSVIYTIESSLQLKDIVNFLKWILAKKADSPLTTPPTLYSRGNASVLYKKNVQRRIKFCVVNSLISQK